jgi:hypothetical protein
MYNDFYSQLHPWLHKLSDDCPCRSMCPAPKHEQDATTNHVMGWKKESEKEKTVDEIN